MLNRFKSRERAKLKRTLQCSGRLLADAEQATDGKGNFPCSYQHYIYPYSEFYARDIDTVAAESTAISAFCCLINNSDFVRDQAERESRTLTRAASVETLLREKLFASQQMS